jgi:hypothetical protein
MKQIILTGLLLTGLVSDAYAHNPYHDYLLAAQTDVNPDLMKNASIPEMNVIGSWVDDAQFRFNTGTPTNNIDIKKNALTYEIRLKPKAWGQREIEKNIIKLHLDQQQVAYNQQLNLALKNRYLRLLDYFAQRNRLIYLLETSELLRQETELLQSQIASDDFNPAKLLDTEELFQQTQSMIKVHLKRLNTIQSELGLPFDDRDSILHRKSALDWYIDVFEINKLLATDKMEDSFSPEVLNARFDLELSQSEHELEKAKQQWGVNFLKFEYGDRSNDELAFQLGINIPLGTSFREIENKYKSQDAQLQLNSKIVDIKQSLAEIRREIAWLSENGELIQNQITRRQKYLEKNYVKTNPFLWVDLRKALIEQGRKRAKNNEKALSLYVRHLALSGLLSQHPLRNWMHKEIPILIHKGGQ